MTELAMNKELNIYNILRCLPTGIKLFVPDLGEVYLQTAEENDRFYEGTWRWKSIFRTVGGVQRVIGLTKKKPCDPNCLSQFGGVRQYNSERDPEFLFDEYGHQLYPNRVDWCRIFPDKDMTWHNWQLKLFKKDYLLTAEYNDRDGIGVKTTCVGCMDKLESDKHSPNGYYIYLRNVLKETLDSERNKRTEHLDNIILHFILPGVDDKPHMPIRLSTVDEFRWHGETVYALTNMKKVNPLECAYGSLFAEYYASLKENRL